MESVEGSTGDGEWITRGLYHLSICLTYLFGVFFATYIYLRWRATARADGDVTAVDDPTDVTKRQHLIGAQRQTQLCFILSALYYQPLLSHGRPDLSVRGIDGKMA